MYTRFFSVIDMYVYFCISICVVCHSVCELFMLIKYINLQTKKFLKIIKTQFLKK